jgi:DNA end-binding protein Ku
MSHHMPRSIWNGAISFGLVNVPVQLFSAIEEKDVHFHQMTKNGHRIRYKRVDEKTGREVGYKDIDKGYELSKGKFVVIDPDELEAATPEQTRRIDIEEFVDLDEIDLIYYETTYYVAPRNEAGADKAYALLRDAMARADKVAIGRFVMRTKQYLVAIRPQENILLLETMYFADEIRNPKDLDVPAKLRGNTKELKIADQLIDSLTVEFDPKRYKDTYRAEMLKLIKRVAKGESIAVEEPERPRAEVVDLVEALRASLDTKGKRGSKRRSGRSRRQAS